MLRTLRTGMNRRTNGQDAQAAGSDGPLTERLGPAPPLSDGPRAEERFAEIAGALPAALREGPARSLLLALADHSPFLWSLAAR